MYFTCSSDLACFLFQHHVTELCNDLLYLFVSDLFWNILICAAVLVICI